MKDAILEQARELGFERAGFARAEALPRERLIRWLDNGRHGGMAFMEKAPEDRADPSRILSGARTVIVVAKNHHVPVKQSLDPRDGVISRYAWGDDYHEILAARLDRLKSFIEKAGGRARACVDTSAILEKPWAARAGIGWQGKHSIVISDDYSSRLFLGEVVTDLDLPPDPPADDRCGDCTRCIDRCPTKAIVAPYVVDTRKCIAYLTIEHRGPIPPELRPPMGNRIYGCDACQDACPWDRRARSTSDAACRPREGLAAPRLIDLLAMTPSQFERRFRGSAIRRTRRGRFLRNVCVALGNSGDRSAAPALERAMKDEEPLVREHASWALERIVC